MPLEIRELIIKVIVEDKVVKSEKEEISHELKREIIDECKSEIITYLERREER